MLSVHGLLPRFYGLGSRIEGGRVWGEGSRVGTSHQAAVGEVDEQPRHAKSAPRNTPKVHLTVEGGAGGAAVGEVDEQDKSGPKNTPKVDLTVGGGGAAVGEVDEQDVERVESRRLAAPGGCGLGFGVEG